VVLKVPEKKVDELRVHATGGASVIQLTTPKFFRTVYIERKDSMNTVKHAFI
ncbi:hypothetical protein L9F63_003066, partial [Diploptera punctata]